MDEADDRPLARMGMRWSTAEDDRLFEAVRAGTPVETLIAEFGRTKSALVSRVRRMLPVDHPAKQDGDAIAGLHQILADDPDYRPPLSIREQLRQQRIQHQSQYRPPQPGPCRAPDHSPPTLPGNPHADAAAFVDDLSSPAAALREALLAVAFELRTANLIAAANRHGGLDREVEKRLGDHDPD